MITFKQLIESLRKPAEIKQFLQATSGYKQVDSRFNGWQFDSLPQLMAKYGFKQLGSGKYGTAFAKSGYPYIIKVFMKDVAYLKWLDYCKLHQDNPWIPKIKGKVVRLGDMFLAVS